MRVGDDRLRQYTDVNRATEPVLVDVKAIREAAERLRGIIVRTPLLRFGRPIEGDPLGRTRGWLKPENLQPIGAFKLRGAYNAIAQLTDEQRQRGVVAHSSGNHAQGVARAARLLGVPATIVMPSDAPRSKVAGVRADGAWIVVVGTSSEERAERAAQMARDDGLTLIAPFDDAAVIAGQGTVGLEIIEQVAELDGWDGGDAGQATTAPEPLTVLVPIGGGGLAAGVSTVVKTLRPDARVFGVEPAIAADARDSLRQGRIVRWDPARVGMTMADGMRTASIGVLPFAHLRRYLDGVLTVEEQEIPVAMARAAREARLVLEPSGATALAALIHRGDELPAEGRVVCVLSGGNVDPERYAELIERGGAEPE
jgi:threonine dehydratase